MLTKIRIFVCLFEGDGFVCLFEGDEFVCLFEGDECANLLHANIYELTSSVLFNRDSVC